MAPPPLHTVSAYLKQQKGYGRAEALLIPKHKFRFNMLGNSRWAGRIYGDISGALLAARPIVYHGAFGMGLFQTLYEPKGSLAAYLPLSMEWMMLAVALMLATPFSLTAGAVGLSMAAATLAFVGYRVSKARLPKHHDTLASRLTIAALTLAQPVLRGWTRYATLMTLKRNLGVNACPLPLADTAGCDESSLPRIGIFRRLTGTAGHPGPPPVLSSLLLEHQEPGARRAAGLHHRPAAHPRRLLRPGFRLLRLFQHPAVGPVRAHLAPDHGPAAGDR